MNWKKMVATGFGTGYLPVGPGSWGTFPGMLLCWAMQPLPHPVYLLTVLVFAALAIPLATEVERQIGKKDPGEIVVDEMVVFPLTMFLVPLSLGTLAIGFFLNRLMDTLKIWPCHGLQALPGGWGIVLDDVVAAVYSCVLVHLTLHFWPGLVTFNLW